MHGQILAPAFDPREVARGYPQVLGKLFARPTTPKSEFHQSEAEIAQQFLGIFRFHAVWMGLPVAQNNHDHV